ncbi:glycine zipper 2TM domain-containing protein [Pseudoxanthomonas suwonensis]|uniref:Membrane protein n=1 Tax=Pseudoxanthomonas suwonensis TaxID=314722 RepID=A0A0E3UP74_9GAMM|nr:glycine zipper 2TM domain-containing protein [Pseudoxanthomonas suwonensis]AKC87821.1 membrane protein [Pseudoxanthomonas suwonensis]
MKQASTILIAAGALLVGGIATAAFMNNRNKQPEPVVAPALADPALAADDAPPAADDALPVDTLQYAEIVGVKPVTQKEKLYATVIGTEPVRETTQTAVPREVCEDVVVQERLPEKDGNVGGTVAGAVIGGLLGNQVGGGSGKKAATAAGAIAGGVVGNQVDKRHEGGKVVTRTERQCRTEQAVSESSRVTGYNVTYRNADGTTGTMRMASNPGNRVAMGNTEKLVGYDVTYRFNGQEGTLRLDQKPETDRLPVVDGKIVTSTAVVEVPTGTARQ